MIKLKHYMMILKKFLFIQKLKTFFKIRSSNISI